MVRHISHEQKAQGKHPGLFCWLFFAQICYCSAMKELKQIQIVPIVAVFPYHANPRKISAQAVSAVAGSIKEFGFKSPLIVDSEMVIINGHTRLQAAQALGMTEVPIIVADDLTPDQVRAYRIADNRVDEFSEWDLDFLKNEMASIDCNLDFAGFDEMLAEMEPEKTAEEMTAGDPDAVPELKPEAISQRGEVFELGQHRLMCGDSTSAEDWHSLLGGERGDMLWTDPPYGVNYEGGHFHSGDVNCKRKREKLEEDDSVIIYEKFLPVVLPLIDGPCYMWYANQVSCEVFQALKNQSVDIHNVLVWHKTNATYAAMGAQYKNRHELFVYFKPKGKTLRWIGESTESTLWEVKRDASNNFHPTQKPVELACRAIKNHEGKIVIDAFAGSGSTLIACAMTGRVCRTMEISPQYCDVIRRRWTKFAKENNVEPGSGALE